MHTTKRLLFFLSLVFLMKGLNAQFVQASKEEIIALTPDWNGERFPDGRPKVPDDILKRMKPVTIEEAWATISGAGYRYQVAEGFGQIINPDSVLVGRAFTTSFMPGRPDVWKAIDSMGKKEGRRSQNVWAVEQLQKGDVYVADQFGAKRNGPTIGDNVGTAIYSRTGNGIVYDGALRDLEGLKELGGFTSFFSSYDPSFHNPGGGQNRDLTTMIVGINKPTRPLPYSHAARVGCPLRRPLRLRLDRPAGQAPDGPARAGDHPPGCRARGHRGAAPTGTPAAGRQTPDPRPRGAKSMPVRRRCGKPPRSPSTAAVASRST